MLPTLPLEQVEQWESRKSTIRPQGTDEPGAYFARQSLVLITRGRQAGLFLFGPSRAKSSSSTRSQLGNQLPQARCAQH